jgi:peptide/nickel transport system permease protein
MATRVIAPERKEPSWSRHGSGYVWYAIRRSVSAQFGLVLLVAVLLVAVAGPAVWSADPAATSSNTLAAPSLSLPFGSDQYGRDILSRVLNGIRIDIAIAVFVAVLATVVGAVLGVLAGYMGGWVEQLVMRFTDVMLAFPGFILALAIAAFLGNDIRNVILAIGIAYTPVMIRLVRGHALSLRSASFILSSRAVGAPRWWIMLFHVLPNTVSPILVQTTLFLAWAVLDTAGLSFIGVGIRPPTPELGSMTAEGAAYMVSGAWWYAVLPGIVIMLIVLSFNLVGDAVRDILDPQSH